jgi:hypothetical protein
MYGDLLLPERARKKSQVGRKRRRKRERGKRNGGKGKRKKNLPLRSREHLLLKWSRTIARTTVP